MCLIPTFCLSPHPRGFWTKRHRFEIRDYAFEGTHLGSDIRDGAEMQGRKATVIAIEADYARIEI